MKERLQRQLKEKLINENIKLREIARATGISSATLSRISRGKGLTLDVYQKLNNYLNPDQDQPGGKWAYFVSYVSDEGVETTAVKTDKPWNSIKRIRSWEKKMEEKYNVTFVLVTNWKLLSSPK